MFTKLRYGLLIAQFAGLCAMVQSPAWPADIPVTLNSADQSRLGLATLRLEATTAPESIDAVARVLDIGTLAQVDAEIEAAAGAARSSSSEMRRLEVLAADDQSASLQSLEAARALAAADAARLRLARRRIALEWGTGLAKLDDGTRQKLVEEIAAGDAALLRVDPLQGGSFADGEVRLHSGTGMAVSTRSLGPAAATDARLQSRGLLVIAHEDTAALGAGRVLAAEIDTARQSTGVMLPRTSLIRVDGRTWVYLARGGDNFVRREVIEPRILTNGWFVSTGFSAGDNVVVAGTGSLYAVEKSDEAIEAE